MRIRVLAGIGVATALMFLTGCRSAPDVAAYVGDQTITEDRVTALIDEYVTWVHKQDPTAQRPNRSEAVNFIVRDSLCRRAQDKLHFDVPAQEGLPEGVPELIQIAGRAKACEKAVPVGDPVQPSEADVRRLFETGATYGYFDPNAAAETVPALMSNPNVAQAYSRKKVLSDALSGVDVSVNPRYGVVELSLIDFVENVPAVSVAVGKPGPVTNRPVVPSQPAQPPQQQ